MDGRNVVALTRAVERATADAPFLRDGIARHAELLEVLRSRGSDAALEHASKTDAPADLIAGLRRERAGTALVLALDDLAGLATFEQTTARLTRFADAALDRAIRAALAERSSVDAPTGFTALALGKQGSRELNFSSDIDPIFLYDPDTLPRRAREDASQAAVRVARRVVDILQTRTGDGYVLRVDLRLRPSPEVFPIALPVGAAVAYYESSALPWERAAFIRARAAAGDLALGRSFLAAISSFVWRRSLDFGAIAEITGLSRRIREAHPEPFGPGFDLKRGRGGIREIEFFAQVHQLIHGGRDPALRVPATLDALAAVVDAGHVDRADARILADAYRALRTIEHRLQMIDDRQTHSLPHGDALDAVARLHGLGDGAALLAFLQPHVAAVRDLYDRLAGEADAPVLPGDSAALDAVLTRSGIPDPRAASRRIEGWRQGTARSLRSPAARDAFEAMLPAFVEAAGRVPDPNRVFNRFGDIVDRLPSGINLYRLLHARPGLVDLLVQILGHAPALADQLSRDPQLLDGLINASALDPPPDVDALAAAFAQADAGADYERRLDAVRRQVNDWRFALGVQLISGRADPLDVARGYARVAEAAVRVLADAAIVQFAGAHGHVPGSELVIVGLGRLGGEALTHASDLDLVMLYTDGSGAPSDGAKPLEPADYFNRLARRVIAALGISTAAGPLYDVDTRLRPSGIHGMLAVSLDAFDAYQRTGAWTFEHMALTRARAVYGSPAAKASVDAKIAAVLALPRDRMAVVRDAASMRAEMARHKPAAGEFDIKLGDGGTIDLEFAVQVLQLVGGIASRPRLDDAVAGLVEAGALPAELIAAERLLARLLVTLRLVAPGGTTPDPASYALVARVCGHENWTRLVAALDAARHEVARAWRDVSRPPA